MKKRQSLVLIGILVGLTILIHVFSLNAARVENYYSTGIYPDISVVLRYSLTWLPFSLGDILYGLAFFYLTWNLVTAIRALYNKTLTNARMLIFLRRVFIKMLLIYIIFNVLWGINYNRRGIASQIGLTMEKYSVEDVKALNSVLVKKVNESKSAILEQPIRKLSSSEIFSGAWLAYKTLDDRYKFLNYHPISLKSSMWGWLGNYVGFMGYYNPFTGEAQVNTTVPKFVQPYTTCHEIAHQLGYAKENEANFVGYLAASSSKDIAFQYSVYLDLFLYAGRNLYRADSVSARSFVDKLMPEVKADLKEWQQFNERHKNPAEPVVRWVYGKFLESNEQPSGVLSYDEVTGFLIAYYKKYGKL
ncbi:MAG: DUF3810 domain-containing protein [Ferruginibacter sp.]